MIVQHIYLDRYDWNIIAFFTDDHDSDEEILEFVEIMGCSEKEVSSIAEIMGPSKKNCGFTYSDYDERSTVIYIGPTTSIDEFQNTFDHEKGHAAIHIATYYDIDPYGEEYQYLAGEIGQRLFDVARLFICQ